METVGMISYEILPLLTSSCYSIKKVWNIRQDLKLRVKIYL